MSGVRVRLAGFSRLFAESLAQAVPEIRVVDGEADVVIIDAASANASDTVRSAAASNERVVVYGMDPTHEAVLHWIEAGANGYLPRDASLAELKHAVQLVAAGEMPATPELAFALFSRLAELARARRRTAALESLVLTPRELAVLRLIAEGLGNRDIAQRLSLSFHTVKNHVQNIFKKLDVMRRAEAVDYARRQGWLHETSLPPAIEPLERIESGSFGDVECSPSLAAQVSSRIRELSHDLAGDETPASLTPREAEVLRLAARGMSNKEIAAELHIWVQTVKSHLHNVYTRLSVSTRRAAVAKALRLGLIREP